jgi:hypothetical protein
MIGALLTALTLAPTLTLPVRVDGEGYLRFIRDGRIVYATSATLTVEGGLLGSKGLSLTPAVRVPTSAVKLAVDLAGNIVAQAPSGNNLCGRLVLAQFPAKPVEDKGFLISTVRASIGSPGEGTFGVIRSSNSAPAQDNPAPTTTSGTSIVVQPISEVSSDTVTLKDIATVRGDPQTKQLIEHISLGSAPPIGIDMPVTTYRIQALAKRAGITATIQVPPGAILRRQAQTIKQDDFVAAAIKAAQQQIGAEIPMTSADQQGDFKAPFGQVELRPESVSTSGSNMTVTVGIFVDGKQINSRFVNLKVDASARVQSGASVKVVMKSAGISVEIPGKTRTGGMLGQTVTVVTETGSVLTGIVVGPDRVEVKF